jgi:hypothetical protein
MEFPIASKSYKILFNDANYFVVYRCGEIQTPMEFIDEGKLLFWAG